MTTPETPPGLPAASADGRARAGALAEAATATLLEPTDAVTYRSAGRLLVKGGEEAAVAAARRLGEALDVYVLATDGAGERLDYPDVEDFGPRLLRGRLAGLDGYLGAFRATVVDGERERDLAPRYGLAREDTFDLVLDLDRPAAIRREKPPLGYFAPGDDEAALAAALEALPEYVGEFEKPRYFDYDASICVHGSRGQAGCSACLDHCATEAIHSLGERIEVDPFLCLGCGSCATVCPTGAIGYTAPAGEALVDHLRGLLRRYREAGGASAVVLFHDGEQGSSAVEQWAASMPESVLPVVVEDTGGIGPDAWLCALAFGAGRVLLAVPPDTPASERAATEGQLAVARAILEGAGHPGDRLGVVTIGGDESLLADAPGPLVAEPARFAGLGGKRARLQRAIAHLHAQAGSTTGVQALPAGAPFGAIDVDRDACTLCMACVSVCPTHAVIGGGESPQLKFREDYCTQCGLCERACPEDAIGLVPQFDFAAHREPAERLLNEEEMHHCPGCGKPFAPVKVIQRMEERLAEHWMFTDESARRRLWLCEDCRVKAMMHDERAPYTKS